MALRERNGGATSERIERVAGLLDVVFTANAGIVAGRTVVLSQFRYQERRPEETQFERWFESRGYQVKRLPAGLYFEGAGDLLGTRDTWFGGYLQRSDIHAFRYVGEFLGREILPLELVDPRFYHLDTCFCPLSGGEVIWFPGAFDRYGQAAIMDRIPAGKRIAVSEEEAVRFACNAVCIGKHVVIPEGSPITMGRLKQLGNAPHTVGLFEFIKSVRAGEWRAVALDT